MRQAIYNICQQPDARREVLRRRLYQWQYFYDRDVRPGATREQVARIDTLFQSAGSVVETGTARDLNLADEQVRELDRLYWRHGIDQHEFCVRYFEIASEERHLAREPAAFDRSVSEGKGALANSDSEALRQALIAIWVGQVSVGREVRNRERASLMRA